MLLNCVKSNIEEDASKRHSFIFLDSNTHCLVFFGCHSTRTAFHSLNKTTLSFTFVLLSLYLSLSLLEQFHILFLPIPFSFDLLQYSLGLSASSLILAYKLSSENSLNYISLLSVHIKNRAEHHQWLPTSLPPCCIGTPTKSPLLSSMPS